MPGPARETIPTAPLPSGPLSQGGGQAMVGMRDGQSPSFPGASNVALGARCPALPCWVQIGMEGPQWVVALGGFCVVAQLLLSHPSWPPLANTTLQISIFMK